VGVAGALVASVGCGGNDTGAGDIDATMADSASGCMPSQLCLDISKAPNTALGTVGGSVVVASSVGALIVIRTTATAVAALSASCTHQGSTVAYTPSTMNLDCPAHGARFSLMGAVLRGPATLPLKTYVATLSGTAVTVTLA
jgi:cytochrome b6-f complex iron-sulfur subunit